MDRSGREQRRIRDGKKSEAAVIVVEGVVRFDEGILSLPSRESKRNEGVRGARALRKRVEQDALDRQKDRVRV